MLVMQGKRTLVMYMRMPKCLVELYQVLLKKKEKNPKANFISENQVDITNLDVTDFFKHPKEKLDHLNL